MMTQDELQELLQEGGDNVKIATLVYRKKGVVRGSGANRQVYGDHKVAVTIVTGFDYGSVVQQSKGQLLQIKDFDILRQCKEQGLIDKDGEPVHKPAVWEALTDIHASLLRTIQGNNQSNHKDVFQTLKIDGQKMNGCKVYSGEGDPDDPRAPRPGTIYIQGLKVSEVVIEDAPNGNPPEPRSKAKSIAKRVIRAQLRVGKFVSYELSPDREFKINLVDAENVVAVAS